MKRSRGLLSVATAVVLLTLAPTPIAHAREIEAPAVVAGRAVVADSWIVTLRSGVDLGKRSRKLAEKVGGRADRVFRHALNGFVFKGSAKAAAALRKHDAVRTVVADGPVHLAAELLPVGIGRIDASHPSRPDAHDSGFTGTGARIAILDTGVDLTHPDLVPNLDAGLGLNCMDAVPGTTPPQDGHGHGTHVAGIAAGVSGNGIGTVGVAPSARIVPLKVLDDTGYGEWSNLICAVDYLTGLVTDGDPSNDVQVANMSLGDTGGVGNCNDGFVREAICTSVAAGIVYVAAAGNSTVDTATFIPAAFPEVIAVSAMTDLDGSKGGLAGCAAWIFFCDDTLAEFSNYGASVDVTAPGYNIYSSWIGGTYRYESGTSMAAPHVSGVAALARAARPGLSPADVADLLEESGECPNGQWADAGPSADCTGQSQWGNDPDGIAEPLVNALRAAQGAATWNASPSVEITDPASGASVSGIVPVDVEATDDVGVAAVEFLLNGKPLATDSNGADGWGIAWNTATVDPGAYSLTATAVDTGGRRSSDRVDLLVGTNLQGDWVGTYGHDGYGLFAWTASSDLVLLPNASLTVERGTRSSLGVVNEVRVPESPDQSERRVGVWYDATQVRLKLTFAAAYSGKLHLYALDYATFDRRQRFTVDDGSGAQVAELSTVFHDGAWLHFPISVAAGGTVSIVVDRVAGANVLINGLFLGEGPPEPPGPTLPGAPTLDSATPSDGQVVLGWTAPASDGGSAITGYTVTANPGGGTCSSIGPTTCAVTGLTNGTSYSFTVTATNAIGTGPSSNALQATPSAVPSAPQDFDAVAGNATVSLSWSAPASDGGSTITGYQLYRGTAPGDTDPLVTLGNVQVYSDDAVANGTTYYYRLTALSSAGEGASTGEISATPAVQITPPGAPTLDSATPGNGQVALAWTAPASDGGSPITGYTATASPGGATCAASTTSCSITGLTNGSAYSFTVTATNAAGTGASSNSLAATPRTVPGAPTNLSATPGNQSVALTWVAPASNGGSPITGYTVTVSPVGSTCSTSGATTCTVTGLTNGTAYTFWVFALNAAGSSGPSGGVISTPRTTPGAPQNATAVTAKAKGVLLTWAAPASNGGATITNYRIYRRTAGGSFQLIWTLGVRFDYTDTGTVRGTTYFYVIRAVNAAGEGPPSAEVSAVAK